MAPPPEELIAMAIRGEAKGFERAEKAMSCPFCSWQDNPSLRVVLSSDLVLFLQQSDATPKGAGIVIPARHAETVFDLTPEELAATQVLLREVKTWMEGAYRPDGYTVAGIVAQSVGRRSCTHTCT